MLTRREFLELTAGCAVASRIERGAAAAASAVLLKFTGLLAFVPDGADMEVAAMRHTGHVPYLVFPEADVGVVGTQAKAEQLKAWNLPGLRAADEPLRIFPLEGQSLDISVSGVPPLDRSGLQKLVPMRGVHGGRTRFRDDWRESRSSFVLHFGRGTLTDGKSRKPDGINYDMVAWRLKDDNALQFGGDYLLTDVVDWTLVSAAQPVFTIEGVTEIRPLTQLVRAYILNLPEKHKTPTPEEMKTLDHCREYFELYKRGVDRDKRKIPRTEQFPPAADPVFCPPAMF